ncbi:IS3 family transposase [Companilactobacillus sp. DQM5]|uniref:IS3 family transposase n=1 Tax=Companilactobacillus sp. DQM5 TaxID=3463359 RepID=UPI004059FC08
MVKYSKELKLKIVTEYLNTSIGVSNLIKKYHITNDSIVYTWIDRYKKFGLDGLNILSPISTYDGSFKVNVLKWMKQNNASYPQTALHFNISNTGTIWQWQHKLDCEGIEVLYRNKGRTKIMNSKKQSKQGKEKTELEKLREKNELLEIENKYLKKLKGLSSGTRWQKAQIVNELRQEKYSLKNILKVIDMPKSTYEYNSKRLLDNNNSDQELKEAIKDIKTSDDTYGYRPVTGELHNRGFKVNHKKVYRLMIEMNLLSTAYNKKTRKYNSYKGTVGKIAKNRINRRFNTDRPYQKLTTDITEIRWGKESIKQRAYFTCIYDLFSDEILSWDISKHPTVEFTVNTLKDGINKIPAGLDYRTTVHSDQGVQYQHKSWVKVLKENKIFQSMSRKATCLDNAAMESFFHILKVNIYHQKEIDTYEELVSEVAAWMEKYNKVRIKQKLGYKSPVEYRKFVSQKVA